MEYMIFNTTQRYDLSHSVRKDSGMHYKHSEYLFTYFAVDDV